MGLPDVSVEQLSGQLGITPVSEDKVAMLVVTAVAVSNVITLGTELGPFRSLDEVEDAGITEAYDLANDLLAWRHCKDFYTAAGKGAKLYVLPLAETVTLTQACDKETSAAVAAALGRIKEVKGVGVSRIPDSVGDIADQLEEDIGDAVAKAQELRNDEYGAPKHRTVRFFIEGRNFQGNASSAKDLRTLASNRVSVVLYQDAEVAAIDSAYAKYAAVGHCLGLWAAQPVHRNIGRVLNGAVVGIAKPALSNGSEMKAITDVAQTTLNTKGFIFLRQHPEYTGFFINDAHTCAAVTDDYAYITDGDVMDKAARITRAVYVEDILDEVDIDPVTGRLPVSVVKDFQGKVETRIGTAMEGEISGVQAFADSDQDVTTTGEIAVEVGIRRKGTKRTIKATLKFLATA